MVPSERPDTTHAFPLVWHVRAPGLDVTVYLVISEPPSKGSDHAIVAYPFVAFVTDTANGTAGTVAGTTEFEVDDALCALETFDAETLNVYAVPLARPVIAQEVDTVEQDAEPGLDVTL